MKIDYDFGYDYPYEYEVDYKELEKAIVYILCSSVKDKQKSLYNENGAYQMAMYIVHDLGVVDSLAENLEDELYEYFYEDALKQCEEREENAREEDDWYGTMNDVRGV